MSNFIKITNPAEKVDRRFLEKLGISTKRDDAETIGQFGSGAKLAPIAALRRGMRWVFVASDDNGPYTLEYIVRNIDGIDTIFYKYDESEKESSFTIDAGVLSWDEDFQIFREAFANAVDSKAEYKIDVVDSIDSHVDGQASVYISATPEMTEILEDFDKWFCFNRTPLVKTSFGSIYDASCRGESRIFNKNVFVGDIKDNFNDSNNHKFYDWNFSDLELNEERRVKSMWSIESKIKNVLVHLPNDDNGLAFARTVIRTEPFEITHFVSDYVIPTVSDEYTGVWAVAWHEEYGDKTVPVPHSGSCKIIAENLKIRGYKSVFVSNALARLLEGSGVTTALQILGERSDILSIPCPENHVAMLDHAMRTVSRYDNRINKFQVSVMDNTDGVLGLSILESGREEIFISEACLDLGFKKVVSTLLHELDHVVSGVADDQYRAFRDLADERLSDLLMSSGYDVDIMVDNNSINFPLHYVSTLGSLEYSIVSSTLGSILCVGSTRFFIDAELQNDNGTMIVNSNNMLSINVNGIQEDTMIKKV